MSLPGLFITFEGGEGAGKTTHMNFLRTALEENGEQVIFVREPGSTRIGEQLREIVLDVNNAEMTSRAELFIYEAARAQLVEEVIEPALRAGKVVLCDRFFDSTIAYQVGGRGLFSAFVREANSFAANGIVPDRTLLMTCNAAAEVGLERATHHTDADRLELAGADFHTLVNEAFLQLAAKESSRIRVVTSQDKKSDTSRKVFTELCDLFPWMDACLANPDYFSVLDEPKESQETSLESALLSE